MKDRLALISQHPLFLGGLMGHLTSLLIMNPEDAKRVFEKAFSEHPDKDGYSSLALTISESDFELIKQTVFSKGHDDRIVKTEPIEIVSRLMSAYPKSPLQHLLRSVYTKTVPSSYNGELLN